MSHAAKMHSARSSLAFGSAQGPGQRRGRAVLVRSAPSTPDTLVKDLGKAKPDWTGDDTASRVVNGLISVEPLFNVMKFFARDTMIKTAEGNGVPWRGTVRELDNRDVYAEYKDVLSQGEPAGGYPEYYKKPFHAYDAGNLCWDAAFEVVPATMSMALRVWPDEVKSGAIDAKQAQVRLRKAYLDVISGYQERQAAAGRSATPPRAVTSLLEVGCSVGVSTRALAEHYPAARVTGLDLSPHFLAVAKHLEKKGAPGFITTTDYSSPDVVAQARQPIEYVWRRAEDTGYAEGSFDGVLITFMFHECPTSAIYDVLREAARVVRPGGTVAVIDNDPRSPVIQGLPPAIFTLMKSTEPWSDEYYSTSIEDVMAEVGLADVEYHRSDPRHRCVVATRPL
ncbi:unnamed protein product [Pedinophyceae sp. YPF-701]|nr:unnamed protein product [Pedinophyceae sp. YPF-701]